MKTVKEIVAAINTAEIHCAKKYWLEEIDGMATAEQVDIIDHDEHRWYTCGVVVYKIGDEFIGVFGPIALKSESMSYEDTGMTCEAFEMGAVPSVTYRSKQ